MRRWAATVVLGSLTLGCATVTSAADAHAADVDSCATVLAPTHNQPGAFGGGGIPFVMDAGTDVLFPGSAGDPSTARPVEVVATAAGGHERHFPLRPGHNDLRVDAGVTAQTHVEWHIPMVDGRECTGTRDVRAVLSDTQPHITFTVPRWGQVFELGEKVWPEFNCDDNGYPVMWCFVNGRGLWAGEQYEDNSTGPGGGNWGDHSIFTGYPGTYFLSGYAQDNPHLDDDTLPLHGDSSQMYVVRGTVDDPATRPLETSLTLFQRTYPSGEWRPVNPGEDVVAGNTIKAEVTVRNPSTVRRQVEGIVNVDADLDITDRFITGQWLAPKGEIKQTSYIDTTDAAFNSWDNSARTQPLTVTFGVAGGDAQRSVPVHVKARPLILVHGWKTNAASSWGGFQQIVDADPWVGGYVDTYAVGDGKVPGTLNTNGGGDGDIGARTNTIAENAEQEALYIDGVRKATNAWHVDVLAHSMGGLISRKYVQDLMPADEDGHPIVHRLMQMGTPNRGSPLADMMMAFGAGGSSTTIPYYPASMQLTTSYVDQIFNKLVTDSRGVPITNMVGTNIPLVGMPAIPRLFGDGIVPAYSARWNLTHTQDSAYDFHTAMTESVQDFTHYVKPLLTTPVSPGLRANKAAAAASPDGATTATATPKVDTGTQVSTVRRVHVAARSSTDVDLAPEATGTVGALSADPGVRLQIRNTAGRVLGSSNNGDGSEVNGVAAVQVPRPSGGAARLRVINPSPQDLDVSVLTFTAGSTLGLTAATEQSDGSTRVTARLTNRDTPVTAAQLYAAPADTPGAGQTPMRDDGTFGDVTAGDGTFTALLDSTDTGRPVSVRATSALGSRVVTVLTGALAPGTGSGGSGNTAPQVDAGDISAGVTLTEGDTLGRVLRVVDPDDGDTWSATVSYGDGAVDVIDGGPLALHHRYRQNGIRTLTITVKDEQNAKGTRTIPVRVRNAAPTATIQPLAEPAVTGGATVVLTGRVADRGPDDTIAAAFTLTRGGVRTTVPAAVAADGTVRAETTTTTAGRFAVSLRATDSDGASSATTVDRDGSPVVLTVGLRAAAAQDVVAGFDGCASGASLPSAATQRLRPFVVHAADLAVGGQRPETNVALSSFVSALSQLRNDKTISSQQQSTLRSWVTGAWRSLLP